MPLPPPTEVTTRSAENDRTQRADGIREGMFKREMWFMLMMTFGMIVLGFVMALIVPMLLRLTR